MSTERNRRKPSPPQSRLVDVARRAGVSAMTVSRALREPERVSTEVRSRVALAVREVGYIPNQLAQGLRTAIGSKLVAAIVPSLQNSLFSQTIQGLSDGLQKEGLSLMIGDSGRSSNREGALIEAFLAQRPCGLVLHETVHTQRARALLARSGVPVVEIGDLIAKPLDMAVSYSNVEAARAMTGHLIARGHRRIAFVTVPTAGNPRARKRRAGYRAALRGAGIAFDERLVMETAGSYRHGGEALIRLRQADPSLDAVFFAGDVLAIGAVLEANARGWRVPGDIAIASFDDFEIAASIHPRLTAIDLPRYEIGRKAADLLVDRLAGRSAAPARIDLGFRILAGAST